MPGTLKKKNRLALEQLDLQVQIKKLLADTSVLIDKSRGGYVKFKNLDHLNKPFSSSMSLQEVAIFFQVSKKKQKNFKKISCWYAFTYLNKTFYIKKLITQR